MNRLLCMKEALMSCAQSQMEHLDKVDAKELGEVVDMIKDLEEALYYRTITDSMNEGKGDHHNSYTEYYYPEYDRDMDKRYGRMYYPEKGPKYYDGHDSTHISTSGTMRSTDERHMLPITHDRREGQSPMVRKMYMEGKETHKDKNTQIKELEKYMQELSRDITEMIDGASVDEKQMLQQKLSTLATKIQ